MTDIAPAAPLRRLRVPLILVIATALALAAFAIAATRDDTVPRGEGAPMTLDAALAALAGPVDLYLALQGIPGESTHIRHADQIDIDSVQWSVGNPKATAKGAAFSEITVTKGPDRATPKLLGAAAAATTIPTGTVYAEKPSGQGGTEIVRIELTGVKVITMSESLSEAGGISESIGLRFDTIKLTYTRQLGTGGTAPESVCWNLQTKKPC